jgi:ribosomal protein S18 acetylase RimI-like enzyme
MYPSSTRLGRWSSRFTIGSSAKVGRMEIREVRPDEYEAAGDVTARAYHEFADFDDPEWIEYLGEIADVAGRAGRTVVLVAVEDGRILGSATIELDHTVGDDDTELPPEMASLRMLGVDESARGRGIGRALVEETLARARAAGKTVMALRTTERMRAAQALYRSMGFRADPDRDVVFDDGFRLIGYRLDLAQDPVGGPAG